MQTRYAYLHGFGSSSQSTKGVHLCERLARDGIDLELLDLNVPSFERQTYSAILADLDRLDRGTAPGHRLVLAGSSMGGYLAARWTELHPGRVDRLFLLCPGFDLPSRWPLLLGADEFRSWEATGTVDVDDGAGGSRSLHWEFVRDARGHPAFPEVDCPVRIVHGVRDVVVPIQLSRRYAESRDHVELIEFDDDHSLHGSLDRITAVFREFLGVHQERGS